MVAWAVAACMLFSAAAAEEEITLGAIGAVCTIPDGYVVLRLDSLDRHPEWLALHNTTAEEMRTDWNARGVLLQAWTTNSDACLEITAVRDEDAVAWHDIDDQTPQTRAAYRKRHLDGTGFKDLGYSIESAEWKKTAEGRFLMLKYKRVEDGSSYRGYARKTIKNGYTITLDYQVYGRGLKAGDNNQLNKIWKSWGFISAMTPAEASAASAEAAADAASIAETVTSEGAEPTQAQETPAATTANLKLTVPPPNETNTGKFTVEGTCDPYIHLIFALQRMDGSTEPIIFQTDASRKGAFKCSIQLPQEGKWLMTVNAEKDGQTVQEHVVIPVTEYQANLLVVNLNEELPAEMELTGDTLVISGTTVKQTTVQCVVEGKYDKQVRTNNSGKFSFKINTSTQGTYNIALIFSKKNYSPRRFTCKATRSVSDEEMRERALATAVKPAYVTLTTKTNAQIGKIMAYDMTVTDIAPNGNEWLVFMAMRNTATGYQDIVVVSTDTEPTFEIGTVQRMYGTMKGTYQVQDSVNGDQYLPYFELIFWGDK